MPATVHRDPSTRRRRVLVAATIILLVTVTGVTSALSEHEGALRLVDVFRIVGLVALSLVLALRSTTSFRFTKRNPALDDELTRANRASAARVGFWAMILGSAALFVGSLLTDLKTAEMTPLLLAFGAAAAGLRFTVLEARGDG